MTWIGGGASVRWRRWALGISLLWWPCIPAPAIEIYVGPFKLWAFVKLPLRGLAR